ncbi:hypothetical protein N0V93_006692 [Gnomoniopsis smithogilvyi]|uniref:DUF1996 domain-containing protein n=1 Tax=Gnomoniopsis smithogilvyi TaxID=1191159 RepID=A0A9W8YNP7_9PEZI|nr:hypothetical protein N0V93_006692 [Gnomoniopsis smithogilvyi]
MRSSKLIVAALAFVGTPVSAFWRMECRGVSGQARIDPLVAYGKAGTGHIHEIFGSSGFSDVADYDTLTAGNCTSCAVTADKSAYWTPFPYFRDNETGEYEAVNNVGGMLAYYFLNPAPSGNQTIQAFPPGFRMLAGDTNRRNYTVGNSSYEDPDPDKSEWAALGQTTQTDLEQRALGFNCLDYTKTAEGSLYRHFMPSKEYIDAYCPDGIRFELMFPSCWDGVNLDSEDHKSHVAYPNLVIDGTCPDDYPVRLPGLFYETIWDMAAFSDRAGIFAISNGDPLGFGYHGDFIMGWDETDFTLQDAVDTCTNLDGTIESCPLFTVISEAEQGECQFEMPASLANEDVAGPMANLPGDITLAWGPAPADAATSASASADPTTVAVPTLSYSAGSTASVNGSYVPGNIFKVTPTTTTVAATDVAVTSSASDPLITLATSTYTYTGASGDVTISEIVYEEAITWVTDLTTTTVYVEPTGVARRDAHVHAHKHRHARSHKH